MTNHPLSPALSSDLTWEEVEDLLAARRAWLLEATLDDPAPVRTPAERFDNMAAAALARVQQLIEARCEAHRQAICQSFDKAFDRLARDFPTLTPAQVAANLSELWE